MPPLSTNSAFVAYAVMLIVLSLNMLVLWGYSGAVRATTKSTPNPEDARNATKLAVVGPQERDLGAERRREEPLEPRLLAVGERRQRVRVEIEDGLHGAVSVEHRQDELRERGVVARDVTGERADVGDELRGVRARAC